MRGRWTTAVTVGLLLLAPAALADSQSAFPAGQNGESPSNIPGSGQGGYLGMHPGPQIYPQVGSVQSTRPAPSQPDEMMGWCRNSPEPSRCRARAATEHQICAGKTPESYGRCRHAMDQMHGP